jgi:hypothetical protein
MYNFVVKLRVPPQWEFLVTIRINLAFQITIRTRHFVMTHGLTAKIFALPFKIDV